jgi:hypothetical protein
VPTSPPLSDIDAFILLASRLRKVREARQGFLQRAAATSMLESPAAEVIGIDRPAAPSVNLASNFKRFAICDDQ